MKDRRSVVLSLAFIAVFFFVRAGFAYWTLNHVVPIAEMMQLPDDDPMSAARFSKNLRFSIGLFGILGLAALASWAGVLSRRRWTRWVWLVACTVMTFSYVFNLIANTDIAVKQLDLILVCILSWILLRGDGLSRASTP